MLSKLWAAMHIVGVGALALVLVPIFALTAIGIGAMALWVGLFPAAGACLMLPFCPFDPMFSWAYPF